MTEKITVTGYDYFMITWPLLIIEGLVHCMISVHILANLLFHSYSITCRELNIHLTLLYSDLVQNCCMNMLIFYCLPNNSLGKVIKTKWAHVLNYSIYIYVFENIYSSHVVCCNYITANKGGHPVLCNIVHQVICF